LACKCVPELAGLNMRTGCSGKWKVLGSSVGLAGCIS